MYLIFVIIASPILSTPIVHKETNTTEEPKPYCSQFDLTKRIPADILEKASTEIVRWTHESDEKDDHDDYAILLDKIRQIVVDGQFSSTKPVAPGTVRNALRVGIHSLASPSWQSESPNVSHFRLQIVYIVDFFFLRTSINFSMHFEVYFVFLLVQH